MARTEQRRPAGDRTARVFEHFGEQLGRDLTTPNLAVEQLRRRLGVSLPVAALVAQLAGLGPPTKALDALWPPGAVQPTGGARHG